MMIQMRGYLDKRMEESERRARMGWKKGLYYRVAIEPLCEGRGGPDGRVNELQRAFAEVVD